MRVIKKVWVRVLISLFTGGIFAEIMHIRTGDASVETSNKFVYVVGIITYILLTVPIWVSYYINYQKRYSASKKNQDNDDVLDN